MTTDEKRVLDELVTAAMKIAMYDTAWDDETIPEVKSARKEFRDAFYAILKRGRRKVKLHPVIPDRISSERKARL